MDMLIHLTVIIGGSLTMDGRQTLVVVESIREVVR